MFLVIQAEKCWAVSIDESPYFPGKPTHSVQTNDSQVLERLGNTEGFKLPFQTHMVQHLS